MNRKVLIGALAGLLMIASIWAVWESGDIAQAAGKHNGQMAAARAEGIIADWKDLGQDGADYEPLFQRLRSDPFADASRVASRVALRIAAGKVTPEEKSDGLRALAKLRPLLQEARTLSMMDARKIKGEVPRHPDGDSDLALISNALVARSVLTGDDSVLTAARVVRHLGQGPSLWSLGQRTHCESILIMALPQMPRPLALKALDTLDKPINYRRALIGGLTGQRAICKEWFEDKSRRYIKSIHLANEARLISFWRQVIATAPTSETPLAAVRAGLSALDKKAFPQTASYQVLNEFHHKFSGHMDYVNIVADMRSKARKQLIGSAQ